jgi:hypothetical protein
MVIAAASALSGTATGAGRSRAIIPTETGHHLRRGRSLRIQQQRSCFVNFRKGFVYWSDSRHHPVQFVASVTALTVPRATSHALEGWLILAARSFRLAMPGEPLPHVASVRTNTTRGETVPTLGDDEETRQCAGHGQNATGTMASRALPSVVAAKTPLTDRCGAEHLTTIRRCGFTFAAEQIMG